MIYIGIKSHETATRLITPAARRGGQSVIACCHGIFGSTGAGAPRAVKEMEVAMPFDGTHFETPRVRDTGLFPIWSTWGRRLWVKTRFCRGKSVNTDGMMRLWLAPADHDAAIIQLLQDAKGLIADAK